MNTLMSFVYKIFIFSIIVFSLPVLLILMIATLLTTGRPVIYKQKRVGLNGNIFTLYKIRTMKNGADNNKSSLMSINEASGPVFKIFDDPRFTTFGKFLSHTGLDELPQLYNVLEGSMALIGPRPLPIDESKHLTPAQRKRHSIKPGIISPWVLSPHYHKKSFQAWMKNDIDYATHKNPITDLFLVWKAVLHVSKLIIREIASITSIVK